MIRRYNMKKSIISLGLILVHTLMLGTIVAMADSYTTPKTTPRVCTVDNGATSYRQAGYDTGSILPYDDSYVWAIGSGSSGLSRSLYAKTASGQASSYTTACTGYSSKVEIQSVSPGIDNDTGFCYATIGGYRTELTVTN